MYDLERLGKIISDIEKYLRDLKEIFNLLAKNGYIDNTLRDKMSNLVFYRNLVSHEYYDMTEQDIFNVMERIGTVREFVDAVKNIIKKEMAKKGGM